MKRTVTLTDESGNAIGSADILEAHTGEGALHRAFSVYVFDPKREIILIQKRSAEKMLWPMIWANTCCSHPFENESAVDAGRRRLGEELGFTCDLTEGSAFVYRAIEPDGRGIEHEHVTILTGIADPDIALAPNPKEVSEWKWIALAELAEDMKAHPLSYAPWFHLGLKHISSAQK